MEIRVPSSRWPWLAAIAALAAAGCDSTSSSSGPVPLPQPVPQIKTLSNRADMISGGDALVEIVLPPGATAATLHVTVGPPGKPDMAKDVSDRFTARAGGRLVGLVTGLAEGPNLVSADVGTGHGVFLKITNHKIGGPVFSGAQVKPFICATPTGSIGTGDTPSTNPSGLSTAAIDDQCNIASEARLFYRTNGACNSAVNPDPVPFPAQAPAGACFKPYNPASPPADLAMATTDAGVMVPYIVRVERGTINRGIYDIAVLFDPTKADVKTGWNPVAPQAGWNGKVVYSFGASAGQPRLQFHSEQSWADDSALSRGFLVAVNSLTDSLYNSNHITATETVMMMKEKIIDSFGEVRYVLGNGCSGGSIGQLTVASIFPGLLDGIQPTCTYPDAETTGLEVADCTLLVNFYNLPVWQNLMTNEGMTQDQINAKKLAINGHVDRTGCHAWVDLFSNLGQPGNYVPVTIKSDVTGETQQVGSAQNNCKLPASMAYDPNTNPGGVRCTGADHGVATFGTVTEKLPGTDKMITHAPGTADNVGVQYGLGAFLSKAISFDEFLTLNKNIGGVDFDGRFTTARSVADPVALATVYRAGIVSDGAHLAKLPIIDLRGYDDSRLNARFGIHHEWRSFALRARLDAANGNHNNYVMWQYGNTPFFVAPPATTLQSFLVIDQWVGAMNADTIAPTIEAKVAAHRPAAAFDFCFLSTDNAGFTKQTTNLGLCNADPVLQPHSSPRQVAGGPLAENVLKCQLRPLNRADYNPVGLTDDQFNQLKVVFPDGVCDFSKSGVAQQPSVSPLDFSAGPGGVPFPPPPQQQAF
jgi:hypothetical protein